MFSNRSDRNLLSRELILAICALFCGHTFVVAGDGESESLHDGRFVHASPVSDEFTLAVDQAAASIPQSVWKRLDKANWKFELAEFLTDAVPNIRDSHPRGWPEWMTWENVDGVNLPKERRLIFPEKMRNRNGEEISCNRIGGVFRHEVGHALDLVMRGKYTFYSSSSTFQWAYRYDLSRMSSKTRDELSYYLQKSTAGRQETFAEAFAITLGGGSDTLKEETFKRAFRQVMKKVEKAIGVSAKKPPTKPAPKPVEKKKAEDDKAADKEEANQNQTTSRRFRNRRFRHRRR